jgi:CHAD domain-containing protein
VRRRMRRARRASPGQPTDGALHEARKAAKRARYASEAMALNLAFEMVHLQPTWAAAL